MKDNHFFDSLKAFFVIALLAGAGVLVYTDVADRGGNNTATVASNLTSIPIQTDTVSINNPSVFGCGDAVNAINGNSLVGVTPLSNSPMSISPGAKKVLLGSWKLESCQPAATIEKNTDRLYDQIVPTITTLVLEINFPPGQSVSPSNSPFSNFVLSYQDSGNVTHTISAGAGPELNSQGNILFLKITGATEIWLNNPITLSLFSDIAQTAQPLTGFSLSVMPEYSVWYYPNDTYNRVLNIIQDTQNNTPLKTQ